uniref:Exostosin GT47 domain-containing protein n=1 Tax=Alexandrium monilatum TaxID=311494 RepID=A0A7S4RN61_9DINO
MMLLVLALAMPQAAAVLRTRAQPRVHRATWMPSGLKARAEAATAAEEPAKATLDRRRPYASEDACNAESPAFNAARCHVMTIGVSEPRYLLEPGRRVAPLALLATGAAKCARRFHALSLEEAEELQPRLRQCLVSTWAAKLYRGLTEAPCAVGSLAEADLVVLPGYTAIECNWPIYGGGDCANRRDGLSNFARYGAVCRGEDTLLAYKAIQKSLGKQIVVLENGPNPEGNKYDLPDSRIYAEPKMSWAFVGADSQHYRRGTDISLPPGPSTRCKISGPASRDGQRFNASLESKAYLASFKGGLNMHAFRLTARDALHDGKRIIISDTNDGRYDFEDLLFSSVFSLILRGDAIMTTRVNEAICSGGIPVLVTDSWIPPFNETVPFETFGLIHVERNVSTLGKRLEAVSSQRRKELREAARKVCECNFQTIDMHALSLAQAISHLTTGSHVSTLGI